MNKNLKVLYIMGTARSGSTILDIILGHGNHCIGVGELTSIVKEGFINNNLCSCGKHFYQCDFWANVAKKMDLTKEETREWFDIQQKVEWHTGFFRQILHLLPKNELEIYKQYNQRLLFAIQEISDSEVIVDSSKYPGRALGLSKLDNIELCVLCLTRSPEGLMTSFQKPNKVEQIGKKPWSVFTYYSTILIMLRIAVSLLRCKKYFAKYETFISNTHENVKNMGYKFNIDFSNAIAQIDQGGSFTVEHLVTGNRLRNNHRVVLNNPGEQRFVKSLKEHIPVKIMNWIGKFIGL